MRIDALHRYPIKGLSPEPLAKATLNAGAYFPGDRLFAIENGDSGFDAAAPVHQPKLKYLMLMRNAKLARLKTRYHDDARRLTIEQAGRVEVDADLAKEAGREAVATFFRAFMPSELRGEPKVLEAPDGYRFTDSQRGFVSLINLASVDAIGELAGKPVHPLRFRGNLHVGGLAPWAEFDLVGREIGIGETVRLKVTSRIVRCAAVDVDPLSGNRDMTIPIAKLLMTQLGHTDCGVYAEVLNGGAIKAGDTLSVIA